jgi:hypothetical protein
MIFVYGDHHQSFQKIAFGANEADIILFSVSGKSWIEQMFSIF